MAKKRIYVAASISAIYFFLVMLVLYWYESSLGHGENSGLIPGLVLVLITMPGVGFSRAVTSLFGCAQYSTCEHIVGAVCGATLNAILLFLIVLGVASTLSRRPDES